MGYFKLDSITLKNGLLRATLAYSLFFGMSQAVAQPCPLSYGSADAAKPNKLYLYFPALDDNTFPEFGQGGLITSPAHSFNIAELSSYTGTATDLENAIFNVVSEDYCEFNVQVLQVNTAPPATFARRNTIAIGTDSVGACGSETWGQAQAVDTGDDEPDIEWVGYDPSPFRVEGGQQNLFVADDFSASDR